MPGVAITTTSLINARVTSHSALPIAAQRDGPGHDRDPAGLHHAPHGGPDSLGGPSPGAPAGGAGSAGGKWEMQGYGWLGMVHRASTRQVQITLPMHDTAAASQLPCVP
jgi:hypothetical protein